tara:strand:- start:50 stop:1018 length:969 start_codon:yes stop_codon:yes gene_type:complete
MLGRSYYPEFYRDIKNSKVKDCLIRIAEETEEDFKYYEKVLKEYGCDVIRPELDINENLQEYIDIDQSLHPKHNVTRPPAQPRDAQLVMGTELLYTGGDHPAIENRLKRYNNDDVFDLKTRIFDAPTITCVGNRVYIDEKEIPEDLITIMKERYPEREFIHVKIGGHSDGCFHTLRPGAIISVSGRLVGNQYGKSFPGWDVCYLKNQSWDLVRDWQKLKQQNKGKWWLAGEEKNNDFTDFVETWLTDWVGYCEETVFDVNVLMLDQNHVVCNNYNKQAFTYFKKYNIEPIIVPFRHRFFWDGGLHCITLDLYREGEMENYFE